MATCVYDNPAKMSRECWQNGKLICWYSADILLRKERIPAEHFFFGAADAGDWETGQIYGDAVAMADPDYIFEAIKHLYDKNLVAQYGLPDKEALYDAERDFKRWRGQND